MLGSLLNEGPLPTAGCGLTVNSGYYSFASPYAQKAGASYRQIIDLAPTGESWFILPLGQSGNSLLPHHHDLLPHWSGGQFIPMTMPETPRESTFVLEPK